MHADLVAELRRELQRRGYDEAGMAPGQGFWLLPDFLEEQPLLDVLDMLIRRRERIQWPEDIDERRVAQLNHDDLVIAIDAIKAVIAAHLPR